MLREVRLGNVLHAIREASWGDFSEQPCLPPALTIPLSPEGLSMGGMMERTARDLKVRRGRKGLDEETLRRTAETCLS